jgi:hypothetical protein
MTTRSHPEADPWSAFGVGVLGGVVAGLSLLSFAGLFAVAIIAIVGGFGLRPRPFGAAGVLVGWAVTWVALLLGAQARCDPASCVGPDLAPWLTIAAILAILGGSLLILGIGRPAMATRVAATSARALDRRSVRIGSASLLGFVAGVYASSMLLFGWATAIPIALWFAWRRRERGRRVEIAWFALAAVVTFVALAPR